MLQRDSIEAIGGVANCRSNGGLALTVAGGTPWIKLRCQQLDIQVNQILSNANTHYIESVFKIL